MRGWLFGLLTVTLLAALWVGVPPASVALPVPPRLERAVDDTAPVRTSWEPWQPRREVRAAERVASAPGPEKSTNRSGPAEVATRGRRAAVVPTPTRSTAQLWTAMVAGGFAPRLNAARELARRGEPRALMDLARELGEGFSARPVAVRVARLRQLVQLSSAAALPTLGVAARDRVTAVRSAAVDALCATGGAEACRLLRELAADARPVVRRRARLALAQIAGPAH